MASTSAFESRGRDKRPAVPVLLEAFPAPPSFIPPSPLLSGSPSSPFARSPSPSPLHVHSPAAGAASSSSSSPQQQPKHPPSAPPSSPLPPVPGPSPITEHETLMFITAARSRRASKMSLASVSTYSQRDSLISASGSGSSAPSLSRSTSATPYDSSTSISNSTSASASASRSLRSYSSSSSLSVPGPAARHFDRSPDIQPRIAEEDAADLTRLSLDDIDLSMRAAESVSVSDDDEKVLELGASVSRRRGRMRHGPNDSISSVDLSELAQFRDDDVDLVSPPPAPVPRSSLSMSTSRSQSQSSAASALPRELTPTQGVRRSMSGSSSGHGDGPNHGPSQGRPRRHLDKDLPPLPPAPLTQPPPVPPSSLSLSRSKSQTHTQTHTHTRRSSSPDIQEILATTPRPRRKSSHGSGLGLRSRSTSRSARSLPAKRRGPGESPYGQVRSAPASRRTSAVDRRSRPGSPTELAYAQDAMGDVDVWDEHSFVADYGAAVDQTGTPFDLVDGEEEARMDRELDGDGSDSDSSLDLHTPLPQLMVKDGLLSPNSKLVQSSRNNTPLPNDRPGSVFSVASTVGSVMTKNGLFKDERDTVKRRVRHRDGKLLAGGIGLTTGLGWSDSEDEDAPAPLVRQLSSHSLKKRAASASLRSTNSATRSYSEHMPESRMDEFGVLPKTPRTSAPAPPTSWQPHPHTRQRLASGLDRRTSTSSSLSSASSTSALSRTFSRASVSSHRSAPASYSRRGLEAPALLTTNSLGHIREGEEPGFYTPSTSSSTASLATPITPADSPLQSRSGFGVGAKRIPAKLDTLSAGSLARDVVILNSPGSELSPSPSRTMHVPRPLRLPQTHTTGSLRTPTSEVPSPSASTPASTSTRTSLSSSTGPGPSLRRTPSRLHPPSSARAVQVPVPVPAVSSAPPQDGVTFPSRSPVRPSAGPVARSASSSSAGAGAGTGASRLKPRTGTGMVYRTTPNTPTTPTPVSVPVPVPAVRPSMLRMPSSASLRSAKGVGVGVGVAM